MKMSRTVSTDVSTTARASAQSAGHSLSVTAPRRFLLLCLSPLLLVGATCAASAALRHQQEKSNLPSVAFPGTPQGQAANAACEAAQSFLNRLFGNQANIKHTSLVSAYSLRQQKGTEKQWSVFCETDNGSYLLRINADTRRVYAMNRMERTEMYARAAGEYTGDPAVGADTPVSDDTDSGIADARADACAKSIDAGDDCEIEGRRLTRVEAQGRALNYLSKIGFPSGTVQTIAPSIGTKRQQMAITLGRTYHFSFRSVHHPSLIEVGVSSTDGRIQTLWSASRPI
jgi:hypothetical protein